MASSSDSKRVGEDLASSSDSKRDGEDLASSSDSKRDGEDLALSGLPTKKKLHCKQAFNDEYLKDPELKDWIQRDPSDNCVALCKICDTKLTSTNRKVLIAHKSTSKHVKNSETKQCNNSMADLSDSNTLDGGDLALSGSPTKKKSYYKQAFNDEWLKDHELKDWIQRDPSDKYAVLCSVCDTKLVNTNRSGLVAHKRSSKHVKNSEAKKSDDSVANISDSNMLDGGDLALSFPTTKKKSSCNEAFSYDWLNDPELKNWFQCDPNDKYAVLRSICNTKLNTDLNGLIAHKSTSKHVTDSEAKKSNNSIARTPYSSMLDGGDSALSGPPTKKKSYYKQAFNDEWLKVPELKDWIQRDPNDKYAVLCSICDTKLVNTNRRCLIAHKSSSKHVRNSEAKKSDDSTMNISESNMLDRLDSSLFGPPTKKKSWYKQAFNDEWLMDPELKDWIQGDPNDKYVVMCNICNTKLVNTNRRGLIGHKRTSKHVRNSEAKKNDNSMANSFESMWYHGDSALVDSISKKILNYNQPFNDELLKDSELKDWIQPDSNEQCVVHREIGDTKLVNTNRISLIAHKSSSKHIRNSEGKKNGNSMANSFDSMWEGGDSDLVDPVSKKKLNYDLAFNEEWLNDPELKDWIQCDPNDKYAVLCNICNTKLVNANRIGLIAHKSSSKHVRNSVAKIINDQMAAISNLRWDGGDFTFSGSANEKKLCYDKAFNANWLKDPELKDFIQYDPSEKCTVLCNVCNTKLVNTNRAFLIAHKRTRKHLRNIESKKSNDCTESGSDLRFDGAGSAVKKKSYYKQAFNNDWLKDPELKDWIQRDPYDKYNVLCKICDKTLSNTNRMGLIGHKRTSKHVRNCEVKRSTTTCTAGSMHDMESSGYSKQLLKSLGSFLRDDQFCDTVIVIGEKQLKAHSIVLAAASSVFREALLESNAEPGLRFLNLSGYDFEVLEAVLSLIYTGKLEAKMKYASSEMLSKLLTALEDLGLDRNKYQTIISDAEEISKGNLQVKMEEGNVPEVTSNSQMLNEMTKGLPIRSETDVHAVEIPAPTLAKVQSEIHKQTEFKKSERIVEHDLLSSSNRANCEESFRQTEVVLEKLPDHKVKKKRKRQNLLCTTCGKAFTEKTKLASHERVHTGEKPYTCKICHKSFANNLSRHMLSHTGEKPHLCHLCGRAFIQKQALKDHMSVHSTEKKHLCVLCGKFLKTLSCLHAHMKLHKLGSLLTRKRNLMNNSFARFACKICNKDYASKYSLAIHEQHHSGTKPFACDVCKKSFWQRAHLKIHKCTRVVERPFTCNTCGKSFAYAGRLSLHARVHTGEKPYKCSKCDSAYTQQAHLKSHLRTHFGKSRKKPFECNVCGKKYRSLRYHLKRNAACRSVS